MKADGGEAVKGVREGTNVFLCAGTFTLALGDGQSSVEGGAAGATGDFIGRRGRATAPASNQCGGQKSPAFVGELPQRRHR